VVGWATACPGGPAFKMWRDILTQWHGKNNSEHAIQNWKPHVPRAAASFSFKE
jgi:hypothetical protein